MLIINGKEPKQVARSTYFQLRNPSNATIADTDEPFYSNGNANKKFWLVRFALTIEGTSTISLFERQG